MEQRGPVRSLPPPPPAPRGPTGDPTAARVPPLVPPRPVVVPPPPHASAMAGPRRPRSAAGPHGHRSPAAILGSHDAATSHPDSRKRRRHRRFPLLSLPLFLSRRHPFALLQQGGDGKPGRNGEGNGKPQRDGHRERSGGSAEGAPLSIMGVVVL